MGHTHDHGHGHGHDHHHGPTPARALLIAVILNTSFLVLEVIAGLWTNSLALLSDAGHMVSDVGALMLALFALKIAALAPSESYTFKLKRAPALGALINGISLVLIVIWIGVEAVERLQAPPQLDANVVFLTGLAGLGVNLGSAWYLAKSRDQSVNTRGAMLHLLSDALGSVAAMIAAISAGVFNASIADPIASVVIGALILLGSLPLLRDTLELLLQRAPRGLDVRAVRELIIAHEGVAQLVDLHIWGLDASDPVISAILTTHEPTLAQTTALSDALRAKLTALIGQAHITLEWRTPDAPLPEPLPC